MACYENGLLTCHAERQRSIWSHQPGGLAHPGCFAALGMTRRGQFLITYLKSKQSSAVGLNASLLVINRNVIFLASSLLLEPVCQALPCRRQIALKALAPEKDG